MAKELFYSIKLGGEEILLQRAADIRLAIREINKELLVTEENDAYDKLEKQALELQAALNKINKEQKEIIKNFENQDIELTEFDKLEERLKGLRKALRGLSSEEAGGELGKGIKESIAEVRESLRNFDEKIEAEKVVDSDRFKDEVGEVKAAIELLKEEMKSVEDQESFDVLSEKMLVLKARLKDVQKEQRLAVKAFQGAAAGVGSYRDLEAQLEKAREAVRRLSREEIDNGGADQYINDIERLQNELLELDDDLKLTFRRIGDYPDAVGDAFAALLPGFKSIKDQVGDIGELLSSGGGLNAGNLLSIGTAAFAVGGAVLEAGQEIKEFVDDLNGLRMEVAEITRESGEGLDEVTVRTKVLRDRFNEDSNEIIRAANSVQKSFNRDFGDVFNLLEEGYARGLNRSGQFLDNVAEYAPQLADARLEAEDLFSILELQLTEGIYSDKGIDALKEGAISLRELNSTTLNALEQIGVSGEEVRKAIDEEGLGGAIALVSSRMSEFKDDSTEVGVVLADVFRGAGEDAGVDFVKMLKDIGGGYQELEGDAAMYAERQREIIESDKALAEAQNEVAKKFDGAGTSFELAGNKLQEFLVRYLLQILNVFEPLVDAISDTFEGLGKLGEKLGLVGGDFDFMNFLISSMTAGMKLLVDGIVFSVEVWNDAVDGVNRFIDSSEFLQKVIENTRKGFDRTRDAIRVLPAVMKGTRAAVEQSLDNMGGKIRVFVNRARIKFLELKKLNPFGDSADAIDEDIKVLESRIGDIKDSGRDAGEAYREAFNNALRDIEDREADPNRSDVVEEVVEDSGLRSGASSGEGDREEKEKKRIEKLMKLREDAVDAEVKLEMEKAELLRELSARLIDQQISNLEDGVDKERELAKKRLSDRLEEVSSIESDFLRKSAEAEKKLVEAFGESSAEVIDFRKSVAEDLLKVQDAVGELEVEARKEFNDRLLQIDKEFQVEQSKKRLEDLKMKLFEVERSADEEVDINRELLARKQIDDKEFRERKFNEEKKALEDRLALINSEIAKAEVKLGADVEGSKEELDKLVALREGFLGDMRDLDIERLKQLEEDRNAELEGWKKLISDIGGFTKEALDNVGSFFSSSAERRINGIDEERDRRKEVIDDLKEQLEEADGEEKDRIKERIKNEEQGIKDLNKKKEDEERKLAKKEKAISVTKSIVNTALAVTKSLPNLILAGIVGGLGAIQTASIIAQPLADGGVVGDGDLIDVVSGEKIGGKGLRVKMSSRGDNILIYANKDEVVLNKRQQEALGGAAVFREIGVKGFADGGAIVPQSPRVGGMSRSGMMEMMEALDKKTDAINGRFDRLRVILVGEDIEEDNNEREFIKTLTELE